MFRKYDKGWQEVVMEVEKLSNFIKRIREVEVSEVKEKI